MNCCRLRLHVVLCDRGQSCSPSGTVAAELCPVDPWAAVVALRLAGPTGEWGAAADPLPWDGHCGSTHLLAPEGLRGCVFVLLCDGANDVLWHRLHKAECHPSTAVWSPASASLPLCCWAALNRVRCLQPWFYLPFMWRNLLPRD